MSKSLSKRTVAHKDDRSALFIAIRQGKHVATFDEIEDLVVRDVQVLVAKGVQVACLYVKRVHFDRVGQVELSKGQESKQEVVV